VKSDLELSLNAILLNFNHHQGLTKFRTSLKDYVIAYNSSVDCLHKPSSQTVTTNVLVFIITSNFKTPSRRTKYFSQNYMHL
jgi:hypothetical protein